MAFDLSKVLGGVSNLDTGADNRERIEYININLIDADKNNFYSLDGIEKLAGNIELLGLQQPLRVRTSPDDPDRVVIVSGHRRRAALQLLVEEGKTQFSSVPCIREQDAGSESLQELRLIYANADTRSMTSWEMSRQAERVEALLYQLKEEGVEFPGRMRDHVAEACKVSRTKVARLKVIRDKLLPEILPLWEANKVNESTAYELAQQSEDVQRRVLQLAKTRAQSDNKGHNDTAYFISPALRAWRNYEAERKDCIVDHRPCSWITKLEDKELSMTGRYCYCSDAKCCWDCPQLKSCTAACYKCADKKAKAKANADLVRETEKVRKQQIEFAEQIKLQHTNRYWHLFAEARKAAGVSFEDYQAVIHLPGNHDAEWWADREACKDNNPWTQLPYDPNYGSYACEVMDNLAQAADLLGCTTDYLLDHETAAPALAWQHTEPPTSGWYTVHMDVDGIEMYKVLWYHALTDEWFFDNRYQHKCQASTVKGWTPLPKEDK